MPKITIHYLLQRLHQARQLFKESSLFRNATFLMASTAIMSVLGFGFWVFVARLYSPAQIGIAAALISITTLLSNLSMLGMNAGLIRFLPGSKHQSRDINAALGIVTGITMLAALVYLFIGARFGANLGFFLASPFHIVLFMVLMATVSLNSLTDAVFIANRRAEYHTIVYAVFGMVRLVLPLFLISFGSWGIFTSYIVAVIISLLLSFIFMRRACHYSFFSAPNWGLIGRTRKYATNNYFGVLLAGLPAQIMPLFIISRLGAAEAAFFSMGWTMANLLYIVPSATTQSLLAESSHDPGKQAANLHSTIKFLVIILVPLVTLSVIVAPYLLRVFGPQFSRGSTAIFQILAISTFFIAFNSVRNTMLNLEHRTGGLVVVQFVIAASTLTVAWFTIRFGLVGIGLAMLGGNVVGSAAHVLLALGHKRRVGSVVQQGQPPEPQAFQAILAFYDLAGAHVGADIGGGDRSGTAVITRGTNKYVLKINSDQKRGFSEMQEEIKFTHYLRSQGVPVPRIVPTASGDYVSRLHIGTQTWSGVLMKFETGHHPEQHNPEVLADMARVQARIHNSGISYAAAGPVKRTIRRRNSLRSKLLINLPKGMSHFDFYSGNVLVHNDKISCVLDFEGMRYDAVVVCIYFTLTHLYATDANIAKLKAYLKAYQQVRRLTWLEKHLIRLALMTRFRTPRLLRFSF